MGSGRDAKIRKSKISTSHSIQQCCASSTVILYDKLDMSASVFIINEEDQIIRGRSRFKS